jgi:hypothetical protein
MLQGQGRAGGRYYIFAASLMTMTHEQGEYSYQTTEM